MAKLHLMNSFVCAGMIADDTKLFLTFSGLVATCKPQGSALKKDGVSHATKHHAREKNQLLVRAQLEMGQVTWSDMQAVGISSGQYLFMQSNVYPLVLCITNLILT